MKNTNQFFIIFSLFFLSVVLSGCPFTSSVPITDKGIDLPKKYIGKWVYGDDLSKKNSNYFELKSKGKNNFLLTEFRFIDAEERYQKEEFSGFFSKVENSFFMNIKYEGGNDDYIFDGYAILKIQDFGPGIRVQSVTENVNEFFTNSKELFNYIKKHIENELFYEEETFYLVKLPNT